MTHRLDVPGLDVSRETIERLEAVEALVRKWTQRINLIAPATVPDLWNRHIRDSAQLLPLAPSDFRIWADLGSGGGFPGLVIASHLLCNPSGPRVVLVESDQRKAAFLRSAIRELDLPAEVHVTRAESEPPLEADVVSARALAPLTGLLGLASRHLAPGGSAIFPKGRDHAAEITAARAHWHFDLVESRSITDPEAAILRIERMRRV